MMFVNGTSEKANIKTGKMKTVRSLALLSQCFKANSFLPNIKFLQGNNRILAISTYHF